MKKSSSSNQQLAEITRQKSQLERLSILLDEAFVLPVVGVRVGWDAIIGLLPIVGDGAGALISSYFIYKAIRFKLPLSTVIQMALNIGVELILGIVPVLGDLLDVGWKANRRNYRLMEGHFLEKEQVLIDDLHRQGISVPVVAARDDVNQEGQGSTAFVIALIVTLLLCSMMAYWGISESGLLDVDAIEQLIQSVKA